mmetsp:Transcript_29230/g.68209  ORF Transcript_29230/g.68209 Transcript_29230/m.68209 type:complete len:2122 (+) Transcript_29230:94-6459(+)
MASIDYNNNHSYEDDGPDDEHEPWDQRINPSMSAGGGGDEDNISGNGEQRAFLDDGGDEETHSAYEDRQSYHPAETVEPEPHYQQQPEPIEGNHEDEEMSGDEKPYLSTMQKYLQRHQQANYQSDKEGEETDGEDEGDLPSLGGSSAREPLPRHDKYNTVATPRNRNNDDDDSDSFEGPMPVTTYTTPTKINDHHHNNNSDDEDEDDEVRMMTMMASQAIQARHDSDQPTTVEEEKAGQFWNQLELDDDDEDEEEQPLQTQTPIVKQAQLPPIGIGTAEDDDEEEEVDDDESSYGPRRRPMQQPKPDRHHHSRTDRRREMEDDDDDYTVYSDVDTWEEGSAAPMDEAANMSAILDANTFCGQTLTALTDICGLGGGDPTTSTTTKPANSSRSRSSRTGREEKEAILQAAKRRKAKAEAMRASQNDEDSRASSMGSERYLRRRNQSPISEQTKEEDENTAIEVEFVEQPTKEAQAAAAKRKNAVLAAMARKARADFEDQAPPQNDRRLEEDKEEEANATAQDLYATFTATEKRKFLRMINEDALQPARAAQSILDEREKSDAVAFAPSDEMKKRGGQEPVTAANSSDAADRTPLRQQQTGSGRFAFWKKHKGAVEEEPSNDQQKRMKGGKGTEVVGAAAGTTAAILAAQMASENSNQEPLSESGIAYYDGKRREEEVINETERSVEDGSMERRGGEYRSSSAQRRRDMLSKTRFLALSQNRASQRSKSAPHGVQQGDQDTQAREEGEESVARRRRQQRRSASTMRAGGREPEPAYHLSPRAPNSVKKERGLDTSRLTAATAPLSPAPMSPKSLVSALSDDDELEYASPVDKMNARSAMGEIISPEGEPEPDDEVEDEILEHRRALQAQEALVMEQNDPQEKSLRPVEELNQNNTANDIETYMNSADIYSVIGATNPAMGDAQSVYTTGSAVTGISIHTNRKRRPGAAKRRLAKDKAANDKTKGWHDTIQAAANSTNRTWRSDKGWKDYEDLRTETINQEHQEYEKIHLDLNIKKSKGSKNEKEQDSPAEKVNLPFPVSWVNEREELQSIATGFVKDDPVSNGDREVLVEPQDEAPPKEVTAVAVGALAASPLDMSSVSPSEAASPKRGRRRVKKQSTSLSPSRARAIEEEHKPRGWVESMKAATGAVADDNSHWDPQSGWNNAAAITSNIADFSAPPSDDEDGQDQGYSRHGVEDENARLDGQDQVYAQNGVVDDNKLLDNSPAELTSAHMDPNDTAEFDRDIEASATLPDVAESVYADLELDIDPATQPKASSDDPIYVPSGREKIQAARRRRSADRAATSTLNDAEAAVYSDLADFGSTGHEEKSSKIVPLAPPSAEKAPRTRRIDIDETNKEEGVDLDKTVDTSVDDSARYDANSKKKYFQIGDNGSVRSMYQSVAAREASELAVSHTKPSRVDEDLALEKSESFPSLASDRPKATVNIVKEKVGEEDLDLFPKQEKTEKRRILAKQAVGGSIGNQHSSAASVASSSILSSNREALAAANTSGPRDGEGSDGPVDLDDAHDEWETQSAWDAKSNAASATSASHLSKSVPKLKANKRDTSPISVRSGRRREGSPTSEKREMSPVSVRSGRSVRSLRSNRSDRKEPTLGVAGPVPPASSFQESVPLRRQSGSSRLSPTSARDIVQDLENAESVMESESSRSYSRRSSPKNQRMPGDISPEEEAVKVLRDEVAAARRNPVSASISLSFDDELDAASKERGMKPKLEEDFGVRNNTPLSPKDTRMRNSQLVQKVLDRSQSNQSKRGALAPSQKDTPSMNAYTPTEKRMNQTFRDDYKESKVEDDRDSLFIFDEKNPASGMTLAEKKKYESLAPNGRGRTFPAGKKPALSEDRVMDMMEEMSEGIEEDPSVSVGSDAYGPAEGDSRTFFQRLTECAAPVMASSSKMADMPSAHLAFLRSHPTSAPEPGNKSNGGMFTCGRPDVIHEEEEEKSEKSDKLNRLTPLEAKLQKKKSNEKPATASVVSEDFGAKTAYLEAIAMRTAVSKPSKKRRSKGDGSSSVVSASSAHSEKWKAFLERKKSGLSADMVASRKSTTSDVSKAAERYAAEKVNELRSKSAPKQRTEGPSYALSSSRKPSTATATGNDADDLAAARYAAMMSVMANEI